MVADRNPAIISVVFGFNYFSFCGPLSVAKDKIDEILKTFAKIILVLLFIDEFSNS